MLGVFSVIYAAGSQADVRTAKRHVRFTPDSDHESDFSQKPNARFSPESGAQAHV
jgi:hypothetical protein